MTSSFEHRKQEDLKRDVFVLEHVEKKDALIKNFHEKIL